MNEMILAAVGLQFGGFLSACAALALCQTGFSSISLLIPRLSHLSIFK